MITDFQSAVILTGFIYSGMVFIGAYALHLVFQYLTMEAKT